MGFVNTRAPGRWGVAMALYLLGIFMGAIDTGIITPARTVIQTQLGVDEATGIWMITIYTLAYAAAIPVMGKLADRNGRKPVYLVSIALFGVGSLLCGLSQDVGSFEMLIASRALQAIGGGGILPIATADIGTAVPKERRGMALGLVGAVYGIANVFGASAGSLVLDIVGAQNWQWIFYINVPIAIAIIVAGLVWLPNRRADAVAPIDVWGSLVLVAMILSLLWGIKNLDFFDVATSIASASVWPWLALFVVLIPVLVLVERRASDPVMNLGYFTDRGIALTLVLSLLSGVILMGVVFVPQFAENALKLPAGSGGYLVIALGLASGIGAPLSGRLTDAIGPRLVLALGAGISLAAAIVIILWAIPQPSLTSVLVGLVGLGLGLGFIVGSPLNYMMLERTPESESSSALGTLSLVRAIGTTLAPALMVGFLANAGASLQDRVIEELPTTVTVPALPHAAELQATIARWKADPDLAGRLGSVDAASLAPRTIDVSSMASGNGTLPTDLVDLVRTADVTTIVERSKSVAEHMFATQTPGRIAEVQEGVQTGIDGLDSGVTEMDGAASEMASGLADMDTKLHEMTSGLGDMDANLATMASGIGEMDRNLRKMDAGIAEMGKGVAGLDQAVAGMRQGVAGLDRAVGGMDDGLAKQRAGLAGAEQVPAPARTPQVQAQIEGLRAAISQLEGQRAGAVKERTTLQGKLRDAQAQRTTLAGERAKLQRGRRQLAAARAKLVTGRTELTAARAKLATGRGELTGARDKLAAGRTELLAKRDELVTARDQMTELKAGVPGAFEQAKATYLAEIDARAPRIEEVFQAGLNVGFRNLYLLFAGACVLTLAALVAVGRGPQAKALPEDASGSRQDGSH